jgi:hypothetical protein
MDRREPRLYVLPTVSEMAANSMRARTLPLVAPSTQGLHWHLKIGRYFDRRGQTRIPYVDLPASSFLDPASTQRRYPSELTLHPIDAPNQG